MLVFVLFNKGTVLLQQYQCIKLLKPVVRWFLEVKKSGSHTFHNNPYYVLSTTVLNDNCIQLHTYVQGIFKAEC